MAPAAASQASRHPDPKTIHGNTLAASAQVSASAEACLSNLDLLSIKDTCKKPPLQVAAAASSSSGSGEAFQLDHAALLSILRDEGVGAMRVVSATPESTRPYKYLPQRVSVMKSHQKAGPLTGPMRVAQFSLDPTAMLSTLQGEVLNAGGPLMETPSNRPTGRTTSIYTVRRVPVTKPRGETPGGPLVVQREGTPTMKWTPRRVPNTRHQPMASMHKSCLSVGLNPPAGHSEPQPHDEDVVQRLFDDQDDEPTVNASDREPKMPADQLSAPASTKKKKEAAGGGHEDQQMDKAEAVQQQQEKKSAGGQPFLQEPHRESVIFFSTGKNLFRDPRFQMPKDLVRPGRRGDASDAQRATVPGSDGKQPELDPSGLGKHFASSLQRESLFHKSGAASSPTIALLRKHRLQFEEHRMDKEVAAYTCCSVPDAQPPQPLRPRCGNPLASFLHFQDATTFWPVGCDDSPGPVSSLREGFILH